MSILKEYTPSLIPAHVASLSDEARADIAAGQWDEVMADALYDACGAMAAEDMREARDIARQCANAPEPSLSAVLCPHCQCEGHDADECVVPPDEEYSTITHSPAWGDYRPEIIGPDDDDQYCVRPSHWTEEGIRETRSAPQPCDHQVTAQEAIRLYQIRCYCAL